MKTLTKIILALLGLFIALSVIYLLLAPSSAQIICSDSDNTDLNSIFNQLNDTSVHIKGKVIYKVGDKLLENNDFCTTDPKQTVKTSVLKSDYLREFYCDSDLNVKSVVITCSNYCVNGACLKSDE